MTEKNRFLTYEPCGNITVCKLGWPSRHLNLEEHIVQCSRMQLHDGKHSYQWGDNRITWDDDDE